MYLVRSLKSKQKAKGIEDEDTQKVVIKAIKLSKETNNVKLLSGWIKKIGAS